MANLKRFLMPIFFFCLGTEFKIAHQNLVVLVELAVHAKIL